jgi:predicted permease
MSLAKHLVRASRALARHPSFSITSVLCVGVGVGTPVAMFGVVNALLFAPPAAVVNPERIARFYFAEYMAGEGRYSDRTSYPTLLDLRTRTRAFRHVAGYMASSLVVGTAADAEPVPVALVTEAYFDVLGVRAVRGRVISSADSSAAALERNAVISEALWRRKFGATADLSEIRLSLAGVPYTVIGIAPYRFQGIDIRPVQIWIPLASAASDVFFPGWSSSRDSRWLRVISRLRDNSEMTDAQLDANHALLVAAAENREAAPRLTLGPIVEARGPGGNPDADVSRWLALVSVLVLLVAVANLASLFASRALSLRSDVAIRLALGAGRRHILVGAIAESLLIALVGGSLAFALGALLQRNVLKLLVPEAAAPFLAGQAIIASTLLAGIVTLLCGIVAAVRFYRPTIVSRLYRGSVGGFSRSSLGIVVPQAALTLVLLFGAGLFSKSLWNASRLDEKLDRRSLLVVSLDFGATARPGSTVDEAYDAAQARLAAIPDVRSAAVTTSVPYASSQAIAFATPGFERPRTPSGGGPYVNGVTPDYFRVLGLDLVRGRTFTAADRAGSAPVVIVNAAMAKHTWSGVDPLGRCVRLGSDSAPCSEVVGIVSTARRMFLKEEPSPQFYVPLEQARGLLKGRSLLVRTSGGARGLKSVARAAREASEAPLFVRVQRLEDLAAPQLRPWRLGATMFAALAIIALGLAGIGLFGAVSYAVGVRKRELGVRLALGARPSQVTLFIVKRALGITLLGVGVGAVLSVALGRGLASLLFGVAPFDAAALAIGAAVLLIVAAIASYIPSMRAVRTSIGEILKY